MSKMFLAALLVGVLFAVAACGRAEQQAPAALPALATPAEIAPALSVRASSTSAFVNKLAMARLIDAETSRIAARKTRNDAVRQFARTMTADAAAAWREFERVASNAGFVPAAAPDGATRATIEKVREADAQGVDARYLDALIQARQAAIDEAERYSQSGDNMDLRAWAREVLPTWRARLQEADLLRQTVNVAPS